MTEQSYEKKVHAQRVTDTMRWWAAEYEAAFREGRVPKWADAVVAYVLLLKGEQP